MRQSSPSSQQLVTIEVLRDQAKFLNVQIAEATTRRAQLSQTIRGASPQREGVIQQQLVTLDQQLVELEGNLSRVNSQLAGAIASMQGAGGGGGGGGSGGLLPAPAPQAPLPTYTEVPGTPALPPSVDRRPELVAAMVLLVFAVAVAWRLIRRGSGASQVNRVEWNETNERLRRIEQAVDTIAVEVERVSESQRFLARTAAEQVKQVNAAEKQRV